MKIKYQLYFSFAAIASILLISSFVGIVMFKSINKEIQTTQQINTPNTLYALEMRTAVFQVQQWFTDASLTRDKTVIAEAEKWRGVYLENSALLRKNLEIRDEKNEIILLDETDKDFDEFYELGTRMTNAYIDEGFESGNILMETFDSSAEMLGEDIEKIKDDQIKSLSLALEDLIGKGKILNTTLILLLVAGLTITSITMIYLSNKIIRPLKDLEHASKAIAEGDLTIEINEDTRRSKDEIGELATSFSVMTANLKRMIKTISENTNNTAAIAEELSASAEEVNASTEQISGTVQEIAKGAQNLATSTTNSKLETDRLIESINNVARAAESSSVQAMETEKTARSGGESAQKAGKVMDQILESTKSASNNISQLQEESKEIVKIIDVINTISEQTNLLALNAAIEAARAGDAGRGFAVVADEVRKLAEESQKATKQIEEMIATIQNKTKSSVEQMNQSTIVVNEGTKVISETLKSLNSIVDKVTDVASSIEAINSVSRMQLEISGKVQKSITEVSAVAEESAAGTEEVSASIEETTTVMQQVANSSQNLAKSAEELKQIITRFKI